MHCLQKLYCKRFWGGVEKSPLSETLCPDLVLPRYKTKRAIYLHRLHRSDICIGSAGLHGSIGWKIGEYVAAAKAIVCEKPIYSVPGDLPMLTFETVDECIDIIERLVSDEKLRHRMQEVSRTYYQTYLRPDRMIENSLSVAMTHFR